VTGTWNTVMAGADKIIEGGRGGSIILISSAAGAKMQPFMVHYTASKHAVTGLTRAFAAELGKHSIRVNSVHPGPVNTAMGSGDMVEAVGRAMETNPQLAHVLTPFLPDWVAEPEEIADDISTFAAIGVHELIFDFRGRSIPESIERLQWFATDVIPLVDG